MHSSLQPKTFTRQCFHSSLVIQGVCLFTSTNTQARYTILLATDSVSSGHWYFLFPCPQRPVRWHGSFVWHWVGKHRRVINITELAEAPDTTFRAALFGIDAFCGWDTTSAFKGKGHAGPTKALQNWTIVWPTLEKLGTSWEVTAQLLKY